jgi:hypothetical protein
MKSRGFEADEGFIQAKVGQCEVCRANQVVNFEIDPGHSLAQLDENFICEICTNVVRDPQQCGECESL